MWTASSPASDGSHHGSHAATSPEIPRAVQHTAQVPVRRPSGRVADCLALAGPAFQGTCFSGVPPRWRRAVRAGTRLSLVAAPAGACRRTDRAGMVSRVSARQPV